MMILLPSVEKQQLIDELEAHGLFFRSFWAISDVYLTESITTACVGIKDDRFVFKFNPVFWNSGGIKFKLFLICHEQLHIMLNHFKRLRFELGDAENKNRAADISINHHLIRNYDFNRERDIPNWQQYCWVETVFKDKPHIPDNETVEFYYAQLRDNTEEQKEGDGSNGAPLDDHQQTLEEMSGDPTDGDGKVGKAIKDATKQYADDLLTGLTDEEKEDKLEEFSKDFKEMLERTAGSGFGSYEKLVYSKVKPKKNWKKLYKKIPKHMLADRMQPHWVSTNRRFVVLSNELALPNELEFEHKDKVIVHVYLDTSGSCADDATYFLETALTLDPKLFDVHIFGFSDGVYDIPNKPPYRLRGFGGTSFDAISQHVDLQKRVDAVFVFTDGYAGMTLPKHPHKWFWFVIPNGTFDYIDERCHSYDLSQYNWR